DAEQIAMESPYDDRIEHMAGENGWGLEEARNRFIWTALHYGDVDPLCYFLLRGLGPAVYVRRFLALMLIPGLAGAFKEVAEELKFQDVQFRLEVKSRTGKRGPKRNNFDVAHRNWRIGRDVEKRMKEIGRGSYASAIKDVAAKTGRSEQTVRDAYDRGHGS